MINIILHSCVALMSAIYYREIADPAGFVWRYNALVSLLPAYDLHYNRISNRRASLQINHFTPGHQNGYCGRAII